MFPNGWKGINEIVIYGLGLVSESCIDKLIMDFHVPFIIDQKKSGTLYQGIPVLAFDDVAWLVREEKKKIVVTTSQRVYAGIKRLLQEKGLEEHHDFCKIEQFAVDWYWENRKQVNMMQVNTAVTTYCTLNCEKCNMFLPYYKERKHYTFEELKLDMDLLFQNMDYIFSYVFLGGEPLLNPELSKILAYAGDVYAGRTGRLSVTTNATVLPDEETLCVLKKYNVRMIISNYTAAVPYNDTFYQFVRILEKRGVPYVLNESLEWKDFGFPERKIDIGEDRGKIREHMMKCAPLCHAVNDGRFYYCHIIWSAEKAGMFRNTTDDCMKLADLSPHNMENKRRLSRFSMGEWEKGYLDFCRFCGGFGEDNQCYAQAGKQMEKDAGNGTGKNISGRDQCI